MIVCIAVTKIEMEVLRMDFLLTTGNEVIFYLQAGGVSSNINELTWKVCGIVCRS